MPANFTVNLDDLSFILAQIKIAERHAAGESLQDIIGADYAILPHGLRAVDGSENNLLPGGNEFGAADNPFPRLLPPEYITNTNSGSFSPGGPTSITNNNYQNAGSVVDSNPRTISNLISDQTNTNPAAVAAWHANPLSIAAYQDAHNGASPPDDYIPTNEELSFIPNISPDIGLSPGFNGWMTFFGQFFDHGLDLVTKGGNGTVYIPLKDDDPLIAGNDHILGNADDLPPQLRFMALSRATPTTDAAGQPSATNTTTGWIDQNQTYTSHASHQAFLREYKFGLDGKAVATGHLLDGKNPDGTSNHAIANWAEVKQNAKTYLGITLTDKDVLNVPLLLTDQYGELKRGPNGFAQIAIDTNGAANPGGETYVEGVAGGLPVPANAILTGHAFLDDIAATAAPVGRLPDGRTGALTADSDNTVGDHLTGVAPGEYDNELLDAHFITGDGRGNENIGLTAVHTIFHSEHNRIVEANKDTIIASGDLAFINEWLLTPIAQAEIPTTAAGIDALNWDGERLFQSAKFATEMEYQHLVFEEFARKVQPNVDPFVFTNSPDLDPSIVAEFAHVVYRFGHSMLTETVSRLDKDLNGDDVGLIEAFLNPLEFKASGASVEEQTGAIIRGMTRQLGNEIDEFVTDALRNNLLGLPLDLPALNMARAREQGVPSFNHAREQFYEATSDVALKPYVSWSDFTANIKNPLSIVSFIAAYGTHTSVTSATTLEAKRDAATLLVLGNFDLDGNGQIDASETAPDDRLDFLNHTGTWASTETGLNDVDFWIGGLAESKMEFGGMLGTTFNFVFENQLEKLQNGDRFYYLSRTQGLNLLNELEKNTFSELVMRNSDLGDLHATHLAGNLFDTVDYTLELDPLVKQITGLNADQSFNPIGSADPKNPDPVQQAQVPKVVRVAPGADVDHDGQADGGVLKFTGGEHVVLGGTEGNDRLVGDRGIDTLWGDGGNDYLNAQSESDQVFGGDGDDIIVDPFGDDFLRGDEGNDVISAGPGLDILFGGGGKDFITGSTDTKEVFAGRGDDFVLGGSAADNLMGNEGDDWIEGGEGFDGLSGENSQLFFNSTIIGHDVLNGQGNDTDYDGEAGDDIMFEGPGIQRNNGMDGFDWAIHKDDKNAANSDLGITPFDTRPALILRDRFDSVEGLSGWNKNDTLTGASKLILGENFDNRLTQAGVDRIDGLRTLLNAPVGGPDDVVFDPADAGNEILLGGAGSDVIRGNLGDDVIDGDAWLNVRIAVHENKDGTGNILKSVNSLNAIKGELLSGTINPGQLQIVREIVTTGVANTDVDTAVFGDSLSNYDFSRNADGSITVVHAIVSAGLASDGTDRLRNIEQLKFLDGTFAVKDLLPVTPVNNAPGTATDSNAVNNQVPENAATGTLVGLTAVAVDPDGDSTIYTLFDDAGGRFAIDPFTGVVSVANGALLNFETANSHVVTVRATDAGGLFSDTNFTIGVTDVNEAPAAATDSNTVAANQVAENAATGTLVGLTAVATDPEGGSVTYTLFNDAGGRFAIDAVTGVVSVANGALLDFETATSHVVTVRASDAGGLFSDTNFTIGVTDVVEAPATTSFVGTPNADVFAVPNASNWTMDGLAGNDTLTGGG
ncbi:peroxidase family protein, partial [Methylobacterium sp. V23]|uniref:peroxidase family protein n=1 Tax=Methylobacterium sp. V23 TaxID=2044878 RepID=UPI0011B0CB8D